MFSHHFEVGCGDARNVYTFVIKIDYVFRCFFFSLDILCWKSSAFMWLRSSTWVSTLDSVVVKKTHFLHFYLSSSSTSLSLLSKEQHSKSTIILFIKFDLLQQNKQNLTRAKQKIIFNDIKSAFVAVINKKTRRPTTNRNNLFKKINGEKIKNAGENVNVFVEYIHGYWFRNTYKNWFEKMFKENRNNSKKSLLKNRDEWL